MKHEMRLNPEPFDLMVKGIKTIELRLNDEKRRKLNVGDTILFTNNADTKENVLVKVVCLHRYSSFSELYKELPLDKCGYTHENSASADAKDMESYYSIGRQLQFGVLGIEIELANQD